MRRAFPHATTKTNRLRHRTTGRFPQRPQGNPLPHCTLLPSLRRGPPIPGNILAETSLPPRLRTLSSERSTLNPQLSAPPLNAHPSTLNVPLPCAKPPTPSARTPPSSSTAMTAPPPAPCCAPSASPTTISKNPRSPSPRPPAT